MAHTQRKGQHSRTKKWTPKGQGLENANIPHLRKVWDSISQHRKPTLLKTGNSTFERNFVFPHKIQSCKLFMWNNTSVHIFLQSNYSQWSLQCFHTVNMLLGVSPNNLYNQSIFSMQQSPNKTDAYLVTDDEVDVVITTTCTCSLRLTKCC